MFSRGPRQTSSLATLALGASLALLSGCPGGSELENPQRFGPVFAGSPATMPMAGAGGTAPVRLTECDYETILNYDCATNGCHFEGGAFVPYEELSLMADATLATRLKDRPSRHGDIECDHMPCVPATCPTGDFVVDSNDWTKSWLLGKITASNGCGYAMPPLLTEPYDPVRYACLEDMVQAIAALPK